jgi:hypothetical protein
MRDLRWTVTMPLVLAACGPASWGPGTLQDAATEFEPDPGDADGDPGPLDAGSDPDDPDDPDGDAPDDGDGPADDGDPDDGTNGGSGPRGNTMCLNADGPEGEDTYALIERILGGGAVEDWADDDHDPWLPHILEEVDDVIGPHFVFLSHSELDRDRDNTDRSRTEIKVAPSSGDHDALKAQDGDTFTYTWRFRINPEMTFSGRFTHMFQLKSKGGDEGAPLLTITGRAASDGDKLEVIHVGPPNEGTIAEASLSGRRGMWLSVNVRVTYGDEGELSLSIHEPDGSEVLSVERTNIDLWRDGEHVRPKWGIYRGLDDALRSDEEDVRFANLAITPSGEPDSDCR